MIKFLFLCFYIISNAVFAFSNEVYNTDSIREVKSIYWLNQKQESAIVYARWENFKAIKNFIDTTVLTGKTVLKPINLMNADLLLLISPNQNKRLKVYFTDDNITLNGQSYSANSAIIAKFRAINNGRIAKGDLTSPQVLSRLVMSSG
jgi:hypothetical protein